MHNLQNTNIPILVVPNPNIPGTGNDIHYKKNISSISLLVIMDIEIKNTKLAIQTNFLGVMLAVGSFSSLLVESETILRAGISLCICGGTLSSTLLTCTSKYTHDNHS